VIALLRKHRRLYTTLTLWSLFGGIESLVEVAGAERLLYGSNLPHVDPGPAIGAVAYCGLPEEKRRLIAGANLAGLIGGVR
jgi:predicted TIM-barrel fold metal-dependent hydrolase